VAATDREPDSTLIEEHVQRVAHLLLPMVARYEFGTLSANPEGRTLLAAPAELRASLAIAALAGPRSGWTAAHVVEVPRSEQWPAELVRALVRRKIAWDPESAALALRLVAATDFDDERIQLVLQAADHIVDVRPGDAAVMDGLDRLNERVLATSAERYRVPEMRARVIASISRHSPPDLLDLSAIAETDTWGPGARALLQAAAMDEIDVRSLLRCLTVASSATAPTARWLAATEPVVASVGTRDVVEKLVRLLVDLDLDDQRTFVATGNDSVARAAIWALGQGDVAPTDIDLLQSVASRCSRTNGKPYVTEALCRKAVGAAITVLDQLRQDEGSHAPAAGRALTELWSDVDRGDVLKRIGRALGRSDDEIAERMVEAKRSKSVAKSARINPQPGDRSKTLTEVIDEDLAARLRRQGFDDRSRRTFRRHHPNHSDVVAISIAAGEIRLGFGVGFHLESDRPKCKLDDLDVAVDLSLISTGSDPAGKVSWVAHHATRLQDQTNRRINRGQVDEVEVLAELMERFDAHALPALDRWANPGLLANDLEDLEVPFPHGELLLGLDHPNSSERKTTIRRLRGHAERG
jgi:hypothetical protein